MLKKYWINKTLVFRRISVWSNPMSKENYLNVDFN